MKRGGGRDRLLVVLVLPPSATGPWTRVRHRQAVGVLVAHEARVTQRTQQHHDHRHRHPLGSWKNRDYTTQGVPGRVIFAFRNYIGFHPRCEMVFKGAGRNQVHPQSIF